MSIVQKARSVANNLETIIEELPIFLLRVEEVTAALDEKLEWREFKFCFKVGTSKVVCMSNTLKMETVNGIFYFNPFFVF